MVSGTVLRLHDCETCPHYMYARCPHCNTEMWAPAVFDFSHGWTTCPNGHQMTPIQHRPYAEGDYCESPTPVAP